MSASPTRIVVVGAGPVGARFVEGMLPAVRAGRVALTVVGAEPHDAYNRVLIADYAVGRTSRERLDLPDAVSARDHGADVRLGAAAVAIDRRRQLVVLEDGAEVPYDRLVIASGARANVPTLVGLEHARRPREAPPTAATTLDRSEGSMPAGVAVLRDLRDADEVREAVRDRRRIVVLGAGVLGMEFALAAREEGAEVAVVYHAAVPMERNLDRGAGQALAAAARAAGVEMHAHRRAESLVLSSDDERRFEGLVCADGTQLDGELLVLSCGVSARTELAAGAGLPVAGGILVDEELRSWADPDIYAIGDCAQPAVRPLSETAGPIGGAPSGLIGPGWRQADWLAAALSAEAEGRGRPELLPAEPRTLVMLKAEGVSVSSAGNVRPDPWEDDDVEVAVWADSGRRAYAKVVVREGVLTGFACAGLPRLAAELSLLFERGGVFGPSPLSLLALEAQGAPVAATTRSLDDWVCVCNGVTGTTILEAAADGADTVATIGTATRAGTGCGTCHDRIQDLLDTATARV
jgi:assimilatory nitrate reductase electron transfer subunit